MKNRGIGVLSVRPDGYRVQKFALKSQAIMLFCLDLLFYIR